GWCGLLNRHLAQVAAEAVRTKVAKGSCGSLFICSFCKRLFYTLIRCIFSPPQTLPFTISRF
ncbi:hypothetical protein AAIG98_35485, partial [Pseudomonas aeruginosa]|uniref:hypothetical protein n=1 Tax=Pseudomonas aeruginosa TaxID=287 RepID=UPI0031B73738